MRAAGPSSKDFKPDPPDKWHVVSWDPAITTSRCIGNPVTPRCALETFFACSVRLELALCRLVLPENEDFQLAVKRRTYWYRIASFTRITAKNRIKGLNPPQRVGDLTLDLQRRACAEDEPECKRPAVKATYDLRPNPDGTWTVLGWCVGHCD